LLYLLTRTSLFRVFNKVFKNLEIFLAHLVSRKAKAFALVLVKVVVLTLHLLQNKVYEIVKLLLLSNQLRSTFNMLILYNFEEETSFKVLLFLTHLICCLALRLLLKLQELSL
jgi:hypothetical protein